MVSSIVGNFLVEKEIITRSQLIDLQKRQQNVHVRLGLIAVSEGLMTQEEAEKVGKMQAAQDKRFEDIAVENGFLTEIQVASLLKKQENAYLVFAQALEDMQLMNVEQLEQWLVDFMWDREMTQSGIADLKSDDAERILSLFIPPEGKRFEPLACKAVNTIMRMVDKDVYPGRAYMAECVDTQTAAMQYMEGQDSMTCVLAGDGDALLPAASIFGGEEFAEMDADALDAIAELINCFDGLYVSDLSREGVELELYPPEYFTDMKVMKAHEMMVLPVFIKGKACKLIFFMGDKVVVE